MKIVVPELSLVTIIGASGSGKSTFALKHFKKTEVLQSDYFRALLSDDENDQTVTSGAFETLYYVAAKRLELGRIVVCDATNVQPESRKPLIELARRYHCIPVAIVLNLPETLCHQRNKSRPDRAFREHVVRNQIKDLKRSLRELKREGFRYIYILSTPEEVDAAFIERQPLWNNRKHEHGPFDIIGDIHGCFEELKELLLKLGYSVDSASGFKFGEGFRVAHPNNRKAVFVGDLVDRGPDSPAVLRLAMSMTETGTGICVPGNHDVKLVRKLFGKDVQMRHGLAETMQQLDKETPEFREYIREFLDGLVSHYVFDNGQLVVAHAEMKEEYQGRGSGRVREFALFGETTGETDEFGLPVRFNWAEEYRGKALVVYGHTPVPEPEWFNRTINIDTGCVFGGELSALRYPEKEIVSVPALRQYAEPAKPILPMLTNAERTAQQINDDVLDIEDVLGKRFIRTSFRSNVTIREENSTAAIEAMSRFAVNPKWLIYLPPTMSPTETSTISGYLEHPREVFEYFLSNGVKEVVCEEKHMGSRAVIVVCRDKSVAVKRFGILDGTFGIIYTRTGRLFFNDPELERALLSRINAALTASSFWEEHNTDWVCLDCELMPWSVKAQELLRLQYAAVGAAGTASLDAVNRLLTQAQNNGQDIGNLAQIFTPRTRTIEQFISAYRGYCWRVDNIDDIKLAPFHILATEKKVHHDKDHVWHMESIHKFCKFDEKILRATHFEIVSLDNPDAIRKATDWWIELTSKGGEGMVVKPRQFMAYGKKGLLQPAIKCRGTEYLRIIYGPDYSLPDNLNRLRSRGLSSKRSLALREFALGIEALERFVAHEPLRRVHECVFGVLALESEPVDPRL